MTEGEEKEQGMENLCEKNNEKKLPYSGEENRYTIPGSTESSTRWTQRGPHQDSSKLCFPDKVKLKEFIITKPLLYEMLKGFI